MSPRFILQGCSSLAHTLTSTHSLIFQGLVLFGQHCANRRCNTSPDSSQKQREGETCWPNKQPTPESPREKGFLRLWLKHKQRHTLAPCVCVTVAFIPGLGPLATFLNVCLSSLKTGATAGVNSSQQAVHRLLLSSVIFYYLIKKQEIRFPALWKRAYPSVSKQPVMREGDGEWWREWGGDSEWEWSTASLLQEKTLFLYLSPLFFLLYWSDSNNA